jgi:hypothetical protein
MAIGVLFKFPGINAAQSSGCEMSCGFVLHRSCRTERRPLFLGTGSVPGKG